MRIYDFLKYRKNPAQVNLEREYLAMDNVESAPVASGDKEPVKVMVEDGIGWVTMNRPEKRNAINPGIVYGMCEALDRLEADKACKVVVLTGAGEAFSAGMDLREYFRDTDNDPAVQAKLFRSNGQWQWRQLRHYAKPTIAMVNGWCFGGAFTPFWIHSPSARSPQGPTTTVSCSSNSPSIDCATGTFDAKLSGNFVQSLTD